ncbi:Necrosis inducing protein NPP1 type [Phytophthora nicotianae]|uniref:Necrosis inducing protein NPP1 type n=1 Tax=Phytophthora nicotianae TaxID=4792 RepID=A0A0W8CR31_PHYNI|nr:Necrosis inducing protein NPP1 type [Phytophthora nicotianae]
MDEHSEEVVELVKQFMTQYEEEVGRTALKASILQVLKAETTEPREEVQEIEIGTGLGEDNNLKLVETDMSQIMRVFLLVDYGFQSSMMDSKRPPTSTARTSGQGDRTHDRRRCPASFLATHSLHVKYDAVELQDIATDTETMTYVRYRVADTSGKFSQDDCMMVILQARGVNTLMYNDTICFDSAAKSAVMVAYEYASNNLPVSALLFAAVCGAVVATVVLIRHRRKSQRFGYSYVRSKKPSHVPTQSTAVKYVDAESPAIAC